MTNPTPLDVWLRIPADSEEAEAEANTYRAGHDDAAGFRVEWSLTDVGLIKTRTFPTYAEAAAWLTAEGFEDYTS